jgi:hypothetical protein
MKSVREIEAAIETLRAAELAELLAWVQEYRARLCASEALFTKHDEEERKKRFVLWAGDGPLNARDEVVDFITKMIDLSLDQAEKVDACWLNELIGYLRCLGGVLRETGGDHLIANRIDGWKRRALAVFDAMPNQTQTEIRDDRAFIASVFDDLFGLCPTKNASREKE